MSNKRTPGFERVIDLFEGAKRFTEDLMRENERLRLSNQGLKRAVREAQVQDPDQVGRRLATLEEENALLREELDELKQLYNTMEKENWDFAERYLQVERQNANLLNLYVASQRLNSTLEFAEVVQIVREIVVNLIGSECFEIVLYDAVEGRTLGLTEMGLKTLPHGRLEEATILETIQTGSPFVSRPENGDAQAAQACIPLKAGDQVLGALVLHALLPQKSGLEGIDYELFDLLTERAAVVLCAAHALGRTESIDDRSSRAALVRSIAQRAGRELSFPSEAPIG